VQFFSGGCSSMREHSSHNVCCKCIMNLSY
jgi:hypothetical protein